MKKILLIFGFAVGLNLVTSCAKDYTCECKVTHEQSGPGFSETKTETKNHSIKGKEDEAKSECKDSGYEISYQDGGGYTQKIKMDCDIR